MSGDSFRRGWCPSLLRPMESGDGWLVRVRPRDAVISAAAARAVAAASEAYGNGRIEITNRANLQIRGLRPETIRPFTEAMEAAGLADEAEGLPTVLVSPLAGADPGVASDTMLLAETVARGLDAAGLGPRAYPLRRPEGVWAPARVGPRVKPGDDEEGEASLVLPPKFGFLIDGGGALPLAGIALDVTLRAKHGRWLLNGEEVPADEAAVRAIALARALAQELRHVPPRTGRAAALGFRAYGDGQHGAVLLAPPFGQMQATQLEALAGLAERWGDGAIRPTPWKSLAIAGVARGDEGFLRDQAHQIRLIADPADPRLGIVTCAGAPACRRGTVETHEAARVLAETRRAGDPLIHLSGCAKGCAHPGPAAVTLVGEGGRLNLIRDGRSGDPPAVRGLALAEISDLLQSLPA